MVDRVVTLEDAARFCGMLRTEEKAAATVEKYGRDALGFVRYVSGRLVTKELVIEYKAHLQERYAARSVNAMLSAVNRFLSFLGLADCRVKTLKTQRAVFCSAEKELTREEYLRLLSAAEGSGKERLHLILQTICGTGIRVSELSAITVEAAQRGEAVVRCKGKTRTVLLVRALRKKLLRYAKENGIAAGAIFVTRTGKPLDRTNIWREMKALCRKAKVSAEKVFPHNLRHLFARTFYAVEKDIVKLADILGHSSVDTMRIYMIATGAEHRRKLERMHLVL